MGTAVFSSSLNCFSLSTSTLCLLLFRNVANFVLSSGNNLDCLSWLLVNDFNLLHYFKGAHTGDYSAEDDILGVHKA